MLPRAKLIAVWVAASLSTLLACYAFVTAGTLVMLTATSSWSDPYAMVWIWIAVLSFCLFGILARMNIVQLVRYYEHRARHPGAGDELKP